VVTPALGALLGQRPPGPEEVESLLRRHTFPIVEQRRVTFVYHGAADEVHLRHWIYGLPSAQPFHRVGESDLWTLTLDLPEGSRIEYRIERVAGGSRESLLDPLNPRVARDPFGANSVCHAAGYVTPEWTRRDGEARTGTITPLGLPSRAFGTERTVLLYLPARFRRSRRYPLLVVHDGDDYLRYAALKVVLDNLIHRLEIPPLVVALTTAVDRLGEYGADPRHAEFLADELLPALEARLPLVAEPAWRGLLGASFGAVASLHAAALRPGVFGNLLLQSGSFAFADIGHHGRGPEFDSVAAFVNRFRDAPGRPCERIYLTCGIYESLIYENRSILPVLQANGMDVRFVEVRDGHNWENWRDRLREGLSWLFPGPLWMVYE
jgi:enterochelin esterase family protein